MTSPTLRYITVGILQTSAFREFVHGFSDCPYTLRDDENSLAFASARSKREDSGFLAVSNIFSYMSL